MIAVCADGSYYRSYHIFKLSSSPDNCFHQVCYGLKRGSHARCLWAVSPVRLKAMSITIFCKIYSECKKRQVSTNSGDPKIFHDKVTATFPSTAEQHSSCDIARHRSAHDCNKYWEVYTKVCRNQCSSLALIVTEKVWMMEIGAEAKWKCDQWPVQVKETTPGKTFTETWWRAAWPASWHWPPPWWLVRCWRMANWLVKINPFKTEKNAT